MSTPMVSFPSYVEDFDLPPDEYNEPPSLRDCIQSFPARVAPPQTLPTAPKAVPEQLTSSPRFPNSMSRIKREKRGKPQPPSPWRILVENLLVDSFQRHGDAVTQYGKVPLEIRKLVKLQSLHYASKCSTKGCDVHVHEHVHDRAPTPPRFMDVDECDGWWNDADADAEGIPDPEFHVNCETCVDDHQMERNDLWGSDGLPCLKGLPRNPPVLMKNSPKPKFHGLTRGPLATTPGTPGRRWEYEVFNGRFNAGLPSAYWESI